MRISARAGVWEQGSVQRYIIISAPQWWGEKYVFEYFFFDNVKIFHLIKMSEMTKSYTNTKKTKISK
jgi:hypothetical protein